MCLSRPHSLLLAAIILCTWQSGTAAQRSDTKTIQSHLSASAPLQAADIAQLLQAAREQIAYRSLKLSFFATGSPGSEILMDSDGRPVFVRSTGGFSVSLGPGAQPQNRVDSVTLTYYTRQAARYCNGSLAPGEIVLDYQNAGGGWTVSARHSTPAFEIFAPIFAALMGEVALEDGGRSTIADRPARGLRAPWSPPEIREAEQLPGGGTAERRLIPGPSVAGAVQTLWIDEQSFLPLRWSVTMPAPAAVTPIDYGVFFVYDRSIELHAPPGIEAPTCIEPGAR